VPGNHASMLREPRVQLLAERLRASLEPGRNSDCSLRTWTENR
jgi:thioesterase domain-containing protein